MVPSRDRVMGQQKAARFRVETIQDPFCDHAISQQVVSVGWSLTSRAFLVILMCCKTDRRATLLRMGWFWLIKFRVLMGSIPNNCRSRTVCSWATSCKNIGESCKGTNEHHWICGPLYTVASFPNARTWTAAHKNQQILEPRKRRLQVPSVSPYLTVWLSCSPSFPKDR